MNFIIKNYMDKLSIQDLNEFAMKNDVYLSKNELEFTYKFVKKNYQKILSNFKDFDFSKYKNNYTNENYLKITKLLDKYSQQYSQFL